MPDQSIVRTPGPWRQFATNVGGDVDQNYRTIRGGDGLFNRQTGFELTGFISESDARLMAKAPELAECLSELLEWITNGQDPSMWDVDEAVRIMEEATGKSSDSSDGYKCECHERDSSYVCKYCYERGERGHMQS